MTFLRTLGTVTARALGLVLLVLVLRVSWLDDAAALLVPLAVVAPMLTFWALFTRTERSALNRIAKGCWVTAGVLTFVDQRAFLIALAFAAGAALAAPPRGRTL